MNHYCKSLRSWKEDKKEASSEEIEKYNRNTFIAMTNECVQVLSAIF
jgi:hypothetical protein